MAAYAVLGMVGLIAARPSRRRGRLRGSLWLGLPLALAGYPLGCRLLGHRPSGPPPDSAAVELAALALTVAPVEELIWGAQLEPRIGIGTTALLFAAKHVLIDGRWRRGLGLALVWWGLGLLRSRSQRLAVAVHMAVNAGGVILGHATRRDRF